MAPLISVIIPIYKVEPYLNRCIQSIVTQTYKNIEIILVDDGSPDKCPEICNTYAKKDSRVIVIHKPNGGLSDARNAGLDIAKGEYISFIDSDDWIDENYIKILLDIILQKNADIAVANFIKVLSTEEAYQTKQRTVSKEIILSATEAVKMLWSKPFQGTFVTAWGKIYNAQLFKSVRFPKGKIHEDEYTTYKVLYLAKKICFLNKPLYFYFQRSDSIMGKAPKGSLTILEAKEERLQFFKTRNTEIFSLCLETLLWDYLFAYSQMNDDVYLKKLYDCFADYKKSKASSLYHKILLNLFVRFPYLYLLYRKMPFCLRKN